MIRCYFTCFLVLLFFTQAFPGENIVQYNGNSIIENHIVLKFKLQNHRRTISPDYYTDILTEELSDINIISFNQKFPTASLPSNCEECVDISAIYEIEYSDEQNLSKLLTRINALPYIEYAEPIPVMEALYTPNDPLLGNQYHLNVTQALEAWDVFNGDSTMIIGVTDTGFDTDHDDLIFKIAYNYSDPINGIDDDNDGYIDNFRGWDVGSYDNDPSEESSSHGTIVAGIACAEVNNEIGIAGVGSKTLFMPIKVANSFGNITRGYEGIIYGADHGCKVINCSWGTKGTYYRYGEDVINYVTFNKDVLVVCAAGNSEDDIPWYPASFKNTLSVAGTIATDAKWAQENSESSSGSSWGEYVDISAPAANYWSTTSNSQYTRCYGGTSFACPIVAGAAALVRGKYPNFTPVQVKEQLKVTSDYIYDIEYNSPYTDLLGTGRLNVLNAVSDTSRPSIVFNNYEFYTNTGSFFPNDTVYLHGEFFNYLAASENINVSLQTESEFVEIIRATYLIRNINTNESVSNAQFPFMFVIKEEAPFDYKIQFKIEYTADNYRNYQYVSGTINSSIFDFSVNNIDISLTSNGLIGYSGTNQRNGIGFRYRNDQTIYEAGIIVANSENNVVSNIAQSRDFHQLSRVIDQDGSNNYDYKFVSSFDDTFAASNLLGIKADSYVYAWDNEDYLLYSYDIINTSNREISNMYIGLFVDWNIDDSRYNKLDFDELRNMSYAHSALPQSYYAGIQILSDETANHYAISYTPEGDGDINITDGFTNEEKYFTLTNSHYFVDTSTIGEEIGMVTSTGPFYIEQGDTAHFDFAFILSENQDYLENTCEEVLYKYNILKGLANDSVVNITDYSPNQDISAWYISGKESLTVMSPFSQNITLAITDIMGRNVFQTNSYLIANKPSEVPVTLSAGVWFIYAITDSGTLSTKIIVD